MVAKPCIAARIVLLVCLTGSGRCMRVDSDVVQGALMKSMESMDEPTTEVCPFSSAPATFPQWADKTVRHFDRFLKTLSEAGITPVLWGGTLLGAYRHLGTIPYDLDMDVVFDVCANRQAVDKSNSRLKGMSGAQVAALLESMGAAPFSKMVWEEVLAPLLEPRGIQMIKISPNGWVRLSNGAAKWDGGLRDDPPAGVPMDFGMAESQCAYGPFGEEKAVKEKNKGRNSGMLCKCKYGSSSAYCPVESASWLSGEYGEDFMVPKSQCDYNEELYNTGHRKGQKNEHADHTRSTDECMWAQNLIAEKSARGYNLKMACLCITCVLASYACWLIFSAVSSTGLSLGFTNFLQVAIFVAQMSLSLAHMFFQERAGSTQYSIISATILVYFGKAAVSFAMFLCRNDLRADTFDVESTKFNKWQSVGLLMVVGGCFAGYDALSFLTLRSLDPATYQVMCHTRIIMVTVLWQVVFQRQLTATQWQAILLLIVAGIIKVFARSAVMDAAILATSIWLMLAQCAMCAFGNIYSEALLKDISKMPTDLINTIIYLWGLVTLVIVQMYSQGPTTVYSELLSLDAWTKLRGDPWMTSSICSLIVFGIVTAYLLKHLSNIVKEMSGAFVITASTIMEWALARLYEGRAVVSLLDLCGIVLAVLSIGVYSTDPVRHGKKEAELPKDLQEQ